MQRIRVMHLIDGLGSGGAERMVVNLVNSLPRSRFQPVLCTSRFDGQLSASVCQDVTRIRLNRRHRFDIAAILRLAKAMRQLNVRIIHAHSTSLFLAIAIRALNRRVRVVWHDHYGPPAGLRRKTWVYGPAARKADAVITVSETLVDWTHERLHVPKSRVRYIPNFVCPAEHRSGVPELPGEPGARIACVAGIRAEKDLISLVRAMELVVKRVPAAHLILIGPVHNAAYWQEVQAEIASRSLARNITWLGERNDIATLLSGCDIGVLSSRSEGFPVVLLEYGMARLATVSTDVGQCSEVIEGGKAGILVSSEDPTALSAGLISLLLSTERRRELGGRLAERVAHCYSAESVLGMVGNVYAQVLESPESQSGLAAE